MVIISIKSDIDVFKARRAGRRMAREIGFSAADGAAVEIAISELASNIVKHAGSGTIRIAPIPDGLEIVGEDRGAGIKDVKKAFNTGKSARGLGIGLSGIKRCMDQLEVISEKGRGTKIIARKWKVFPSHLVIPARDCHAPADGLMTYGVVSSPALGSKRNGDAYVIKEFDNKVLIAVIDALGHGRRAFPVSRDAADYIQKHCTANLSALIEGRHEVLRGSRGAVMGLVKVDMERAGVSYSGVGNIGVKIVGENTTRPISTPGIVGHHFGKLLEQAFPYNKGDVIFIHSDGVSDKFDPREPGFKSMPPRALAERIVRGFGKEMDDNTIVVAREIV